MLVLASEQHDGIDDLVRQGSALGGVRLGGERAAVFPERAEDDERERKGFVSLEATVLAHLAGETLLRLLFAFDGWPEEPWIEVASQVNPKAFKRRIAALLGAEDERRRLASELLVPIDEEPPRAVAVATYADLLGRVAERLTVDAPLYNASKHGLAVIADDQVLRVCGGDPGPSSRWFALAGGPALEFLEWERVDDRRHWKQTTSWIDLGSTLTEGLLTIQAIEMAWAVGRAVYLQTSETFRVPTTTLADLMNGASTTRSARSSWAIGSTPLA